MNNTPLEATLTYEQRQLLPQIEWLFDPIAHRGSGRTHLIAVAFINLAIRYAGIPIRVIDHTPQNGSRNNYAFEAVCRILANNPYPNKKFDIMPTSNTIVCVPSAPTSHYEIYASIQQTIERVIRNRKQTPRKRHITKAK